MRKINFFLFGVLLSFLFFVPFSYSYDCNGLNFFDGTTNDPDGSMTLGSSTFATFTDGKSYVYSDLVSIETTSECLSGTSTSTGFSNYGTYSHQKCSSVNNACGDGKRLVTCTVYIYSNSRTGDTSCDPGTSPGDQSPSHCSDNQLSGDEIGIDCGGSCQSECTFHCPVGTVHKVTTDTDISYCAQVTSPDKFGACPKGSVLTTDKSECHKIEIGYQMSQNFYDDNFSLKTFEDLEIEPLTDFSTLPYDSWTDIGTETVTDNGDGTETAKITTTWKNPDGSTGSKDTVVERPSGSPSGTGFSSGGSGGGGSSAPGVANGFKGSSQESGDIPVEENPENYDYQLGDGEGSFDGSISDDDIPEEKSITDLWDGFLSNNPFTVLITGSSIETSNAVCSFQFNYKGSPVTFSLCDEPWPSTLNFMGQILLFISTVSTYFVIFGRG